MNDLEKILSLLEQQKELFEQYEKFTDELLTCDADAGDNYITKRSELAIKIDNNKAEIDKTSNESSVNGIAQAVRCEGNYSEYKSELLPIYNLAREIFACVSRIADKNEEIIARMTDMRNEARDKLESSKNTPKIKKYLGALSSTTAQGIFTGNDKKA